MTSYELKNFIINNNKIEIVINELGCHHFKTYNKEYRCGLPNHNSTNSVSIKKDTLQIKVFQSDSEIIRGDIFTLIMNIKNISFSESNKYLHELLGLKYTYKSNKKNKENKKNILNIFEKVKKQRLIVNKEELEVIDNSILKEYVPLPHIDWVREGIMPKTCEVFNIGYSYDKKRIIIPHRYWCGDENEYVGIIGRTTIKEYKILDIPKYFPLKPYPKSINVYGLQENYKYIQESGYINVAESEKSVLKRHSKNDKTFGALCCHDISDEQAKILIGLDVDIVIQMDKGISLNHIRSLCEKFYGIRNVYYIYDKYDLLKDKEAPADACNKIYNYLWKYKVKYDEKERREYLKWLEKANKN